MNEPCLIFLHVPKTAGSTLTTVLRWQYRKLPPAEIMQFFPKERFDEISKLPVEQRARLKVLTGHFAYGVHDYIPRPSRYITLVREPVQRVLSVYRYVLSAPSHPLHQTLTSSRMDLKEYVTSGIHREQAENAMTRQLAGTDQEDELTTRDLEIAKRNLRTCLAIGLTEAFDESLILFKRVLGWSVPFYFSRNLSRQGPRLDQVPQGVLELIRERNRFDVEVHELAHSQFRTLVQQHGDGFATEVNRFKLLNRIPQALGGVLEPMAPKVRRRLERRAIRRSSPV